MLPGMEEALRPARSAPAADPTRFQPADEPSSPPGPLDDATVFVVDTHALIYQLFHAMPEMTGPQGEPVGAVYGVARDVIFLLEVQKPDYLFCAFDLPGATFRHELYEPYKSHRPEMPDELVPQIDAVYELIEAFGIPALGCPGYEADDVMATVARLTEQHGGRCYLVTGDKDCRQLIGDRVFLYNIRKNQVFDRRALEAEWGIAPEQVVDFQALVGDSTDNVPGVPLVGPKLAGQLLRQFGTLDAVLDSADQVPGAKRRQNLIEFRQQALLSRQLVRLDRNVPVRIDWEAGRTARLDVLRVADVFRRFGFRSLLEKVETLASGAKQTQPGTRPAVEATYHLVDTPEKLAELVGRLQQQPCISVDTETTHVWPRWAQLVGISVACDPHQAWYIPVRAPAGENHLDQQQVLDALRPVLENPRIEKIGQNLKYDVIVLRAAGVQLAGVRFDTMVASYLLDAGTRNHNLDELARRYLRHTPIKITQLIGTGKKQRRMDQVPVQQVTEYAGEDALLPLLLRPILAQRLAETGLERLFAEVEMPLVEVLADLEYTGVTIDRLRLEQLGRQLADQLSTLEHQIHQLAGGPFNIASPKQLGEVLFGQLGLPVLKRTQSGPSTDAEVLEQLAPTHPLPAKLLEYRQLAKLKGTYVDALPGMIFPATGRVHASLNQVVTATGRLSSSDPNLQNIPVRTELGRQIRSAFVPGEPGWLLLSADYSQIELRVLAHFSGDERLCEAFGRDEDIHARVASEIYHVPLEEVTAPMRRAAKAVNFGVIYGQSPFGLAKQLGIDKHQAAQFIDAYFAGYPGIDRFLAEVLAQCSKTGYVSTLLGRRRAIQGVRSQAPRQKNLAERTAINTVIQGSAADLIKLAMLAVDRHIRSERLPARMLLQIHDELLFEVAAPSVDRLAELVTARMEQAAQLRVPLKVDVKVGPNWSDVTPWPLKRSGK